MAYHAEKESFPPIALLAGMRIQLEAIDPTTGDEVAGVVADRWSIYGEDQSEGPDEPGAPVEWVSIPMGD